MNAVHWTILAVTAVSLIYLGYFLWFSNRTVTAADKAIASVAVLLLAGLVIYQANASPSPRSSASPATDSGVIDRYHQLFYDAEDTWKTTKWLGVPTMQNPNDIWIHQEIIAEIKPDFIIETGTNQGGSAALWAMVLAQVNPSGRVITIDIKDMVTLAKELPIVKERVEFLVGSSTDPEIVDRVKKLVAGKKVLVILDSAHTRDHVLAELKAYGPLVPVGSYMIVQDTNVNGHPVFNDYGPGPWEAVEEFLQDNDQFVPDKSRERLMMTMHPQGYLKRVKKGS